MQDTIGIAFITVAAAQVLGTLVYLLNAGRLFRRLEQRHKVVHESIGSPLLIMNNTPRNNRLFFRWIWNRDFQELGDPESVALASLVRSLLVWLLSGFAVLIALFVALAATS
jgi:hypothetical protein